jgi:hypothetical protein
MMETTYKEHKIEVTTDFKFRITGPLFDGNGRDNEFGAIAEARGAIEKRSDALVKQRKAETTVALAVLDDQGKSAVVRGIHASQGGLLGVGASDGVFPDVPWVKELLIKRAALRAELQAIELKVKPYRVNTRRGYGRVDPLNYEAMIGQVTAELSVATERAKKQ